MKNAFVFNFSLSLTPVLVYLKATWQLNGGVHEQRCSTQLDKWRLHWCQASLQFGCSVSHGAESSICITRHFRDTNASTDVRLVREAVLVSPSFLSFCHFLLWLFLCFCHKHFILRWVTCPECLRILFWGKHKVSSFYYEWMDSTYNLLGTLSL